MYHFFNLPIESQAVAIHEMRLDLHLYNFDTDLEYQQTISDQGIGKYIIDNNYVFDLDGTNRFKN